MRKFQKKLWAGLIVMALLSPLGIIIPEMFKSGDAWGEWGAETLQKLLGYVPEGMKKYANLYKAPAPDYSLGGENASMPVQIISYIISGIIGMLLLALAVYLIKRFLRKHEK